MLQCLSLKSSSATSTSNSLYPPQANSNSTDGTPRSSTQVSPTTINLTDEYIAQQTNSYKEMLYRMQFDNNNNNNNNNNQDITQVLNPSRECVEEALRHKKPNSLTRLVSKYFDLSENTTNLCVSLHHSISLARKNYGPIHQLLEILPHDSYSLTQSQCDWAFDVFHQFVRLDNPFPSPHSHYFHEMQCCFSQLKQQLDNRLRKSQSGIKLRQRGSKISSALCFGAAYFPLDFTKKKVARMAQLKAAERGTFVLSKHLDTIDRSVARLHTAIEDDKSFIRLGLEWGRDMYPIQMVVKQLRRSHVNLNSQIEDHVNLNSQLEDLEGRICLCFTMVNRTRSLLLQEIHLQSSSNS